MHPSEMKNFLFVFAAKAEQDGFSGTAEALVLLAEACAEEARELSRQASGNSRQNQRHSTQGSNAIPVGSH
ncbi:MAG: hypothetical protein U1E06_08830 [Tabrizicola sp.]|nr:hypothetical protein [Tabrizicola sp.]